MARSIGIGWRNGSEYAPIIQSLYLIYLRVIACCPWYHEVEDTIKADVIESQRTGVLSPGHARNRQQIVKSMYKHLMEMPRTALLYVGCDPGDGSCSGIKGDMADPISIELNAHQRMWLSIQHPPALTYEDMAHLRNSNGSATEMLRRKEQKDHALYPSVKRNFKLSLGQVGTVERNLNNINSIVHQVGNISVAATASRDSEDRIPDKVMTCLKYRLSRRNEPGICEKLGFKEQSDYESWLRENRIDLEPRHSHSVYEKWLEAAQKLGVDTPRDHGAKVTSVSEPHKIQPDETPLAGNDEDSADRKSRGSVKQSDDFWIVAFDGEKAQPIKDLLGFRYIVFLLRNPKKSFHAPTLVRLVEQPELIDSWSQQLGQLSDDQLAEIGFSRTQLECPTKLMDYRARKEIEETRDSLLEKLEGGQFADPDERMQCRDQLDLIKRVLATSIDLFGSTRVDSKVEERARAKVRKNIRTVLDKLRSPCGTLWHHLDKSINYGRNISYNPDSQVNWDL